MATVVPAGFQSDAVPRPAERTETARVVSLDVFRGLTMILLISHAFGIPEAMRGQDSWIAAQFEHVKWVGCTLWDLIQPAFTFIVGAAMPYALGRRLREGQSRGQVFGHVLWRAALLIALSNVLINWNSSTRPRLQLINVL
ncbi:MAG TPA: DUF5009 domain-containing protein, partial [Bryobacteraceae bacterium]|nr:DUF5009 domain-containing protein [Bryobacteraceae bacterium]